MTSAPSSVPRIGRPAAGQQRAADRHRRDGVELHAEADQIGVGAPSCVAMTIRPGDAGAAAPLIT